MKIKRIEIKNLWQKGSIIWELDPDVNILVGNNGSGKSTIINFVYEALQPKISEEAKLKFGLMDEMTIQLSEEGKEDSFIYVDSSGERFPATIADFNADKISTFDISSSLDNLIADLRLPFEIYQKTLLKTIEELWYKADTLPSKEERDRYFGKKNLFLKYLNKLFSETGKSFSEETFTFKLTGQKYELTHDKLSSGEKQLFYILLHVLLQDGKPWVLLMDEPEISLHIDWQRILLRYIRELNDNCQCIVVTHSPTIFFKGWEDKMKRIEQIISQNQNGILRLNLPSKESLIITELKRLKKIGLSNDVFLKELNSYLHREFYMLSPAECGKIISFMSEFNIKPDVFTYTTLISKVTQKEEAFRLLQEMKKKKITANSFTYSHVLKKASNLKEAIGVMDMMIKEGIEPNIVHFKTLLGKAEKPEEINEVEQLRQQYGVSVDEAYNNKLRIKQ